MTVAVITFGAAAGFGNRLYAAMHAYGPVCVGIDPHASLLREWGFNDDTSDVHESSLRVTEALGGHIAAFKPQAAFFERHGSRGVAVLEEVIAACREVSMLYTVDTKHGDTGSTMDGYAQAFLSDSPPLTGDAVTLSSYLGVGSLTPALESARQTHRGVFVLALASNPEGASIQYARGKDGTSVADRVISQLTGFNNQCGQQHLGPMGIVVGATVGDAVRRLGINFPSLNGVFLAPGLDAQDAGPAQVRGAFAGAEDTALTSSPHTILRTGLSITGLRDAYRATVNLLQ